MTLKDNSWIARIKDQKLKKYSQNGEEGYIDYILSNLRINNPDHQERKLVVDIGASDGYSNSNSRLLIEQEKYEAILIDGNNKGNNEVHQEWVTVESITKVLAKYNCPIDFNLLSLDLDGNDYDIITEILHYYRPRLVVCEINGCIPLGVSKKIRYNPDHKFENNDYYGFSFSAAHVLAEHCGYRVIFQNDGLNVYLVRADLISPEPITVPFKHLQYHPHSPNRDWEIVTL